MPLCPQYKNVLMKLRRSVLLVTSGARVASAKNLAQFKADVSMGTNVKQERMRFWSA
jgi:hypothetical protein